MSEFVCAIRSRGKVAGIVILSVLLSVGGTVGIAYAVNPNLLSIFPNQPVQQNMLVFQTNTTTQGLLFGDGMPTCHLTQVSTLLVEVDHDAFDYWYHREGAQMFQDNRISMLAIGQFNLSAYSNGSNPAIIKFPFYSNITLAIVQFGFTVIYDSGSQTDYYSVSLFNLAGQSNPPINYTQLVVENDTTYRITFGGLHYNSSLAHFDWMSMSLNGITNEWPLS